MSIVNAVINIRKVTTITLLKITLSLSILVGLSACDIWKYKEEILSGKRISVMLLENDLEPDARLSDLAVILPKPYTNQGWLQNGGYSDHAMHHLDLAANITKIWSVDIGDGGNEEQRLLNAPVIADGFAYVMDVDYQLRTFNADNGKLIWQKQLDVPEEDEEAFGGGIAYLGGMIFISTGFAEIIALNAKNGEEIWRKKVSAPVRSSPTASVDNIYVITIDNQIFALNSKTGNNIWVHAGFSENAGLLGGSSVAAIDDFLAVPFSSGELFALKASTGKVIWSDNLTSLRRSNAISALADIRGAPVIDRGVIYAISHSGKMAAIDIKTGGRIWTKRLSSKQTPWVAGEFIFVLTSDNYLLAMTRRGGMVRWLTPLPSWQDMEDKEDAITWVGPILAGDRLILANSLGEILTISPYTGLPLGKIDVGSPIMVSPVVANKTLYIQTESGKLIAYR